VRGLLLVGLTACTFTRGSPLVGTGSGSDGGTDSRVDAPTDAPRDARPDAPRDAALDAAALCVNATCMTYGGTCSGGTCDITAQNGQNVQCPPAEKCAVSCPTDNQSCLNGMICSNLATCTFDCLADHSCEQNPLTCDTGSTCTIYCRSTHACDNLTINCNAGATCNYYCCGGGTACVNFQCNGAGCHDAGTTCP
jgi:hypothetical protein